MLGEVMEREGETALGEPEWKEATALAAAIWALVAEWVTEDVGEDEEDEEEPRLEEEEEEEEGELELGKVERKTGLIKWLEIGSEDFERGTTGEKLVRVWRSTILTTWSFWSWRRCEQLQFIVWVCPDFPGPDERAP